MKLAAIVLALGSLVATASADTYSGPPGNYDAPQAELANQPGQMRPARNPQNGALREAIVARFDRDGDGQLSPQERRQAVRALRRVARQMARENRRERRAERQERRAERHQMRQGQQGAPRVDVDVDIQP